MRFRRGRWAGACAAATIIVALGAAAAEKGKHVMDEAAVLLERLKAIPEAHYFSRNAQSLQGLTIQGLGTGFRGVLIGAPHQVDADAQARLPVVMLALLSSARLGAVPLQRNAVAVAVDLDGGQCHAGPAFVADPSKTPDRIEGEPQAPAAPPPPAAPPRSAEDQALLDELGHGDTAALSWFDFRSLLHLPRVRANYLLRVIYYDQVSNAVRVEVKARGESVAGFAPEAARALAQGQPELPWARTRVGRTGDSPVFEGEGVRLKLLPVRAVGTERSVTAHGTVRLALTPGMRVVGAGGPQPTAGVPAAVIRASLLFMPRNSAQPVQVRLELPVQSSRELRVGELVEAAFTTELSLHVPVDLAGADIGRLYLVAGPHLSPAAVVALQ